MIKIGSMVSSLKGHDIERIYVIVKLQKEFAYVVDGKYRLLNNPKKKRLKHLKDLFITYDENFEKLLNDNKIHDFEIKTKIKGISKH